MEDIFDNLMQQIVVQQKRLIDIGKRIEIIEQKLPTIQPIKDATTVASDVCPSSCPRDER